MILFAKALVKLPVSMAYPVLAGVGFLLLILFAGVFFFDERFSFFQWIGLSVMVFEIIIMAKVI